MSPKTADPAVRAALVEAAARLIAQREPLTTRRVATEIGTSTMAVYTHFGSMEELRRAVRHEGFARLADHLSRVPKTADPVADLVHLGAAYCLNALTNPDLYRVMFMEAPVDDEDAVVGLDTFETLVEGVQRCLDAGRFEPADASSLATQLWAVSHGVVALQIAQMFTIEDATELLMTTARNLLLAFGGDTVATQRSIDRAVRREEPAL